MGKKYGALTDFPATAQLKAEGAKLRGSYEGFREIKTKFGTAKVHAMKVMANTTCDFTRNKDTYEPVIGEPVEFLGGAVLDSTLPQVPVGTVITITYKGLGKATKGNPPHLFDVEGD